MSKNSLYYRSKSESGGTNCLALLIFILISATIGGFLWKYSVNNWLEWAGKPQSFKFWHGFLVGLFPPVGFGSIPVAIITFVLSFFFV